MANRAAFSVSRTGHPAAIKRTGGCLRQSFVSRLLAFAALSVGVCLAKSESDQVIAQVESHYNSAHTLTVHFSEALEAGGHSRPSESGLLTLEKQGKMRWDYAKPAGKLFLSDGKSVYLYTAGDNRVEKIAIRDTEDMRAPLAFLLGRLDLRKEFRDFSLRPTEGGNWLSASAKTDRVPYAHVEMLVAADGSIRELHILGRDGNTLSFSFNGERVNPPVSENLFRFVIPPGAQVVDAMELEGEGK